MLIWYTRFDITVGFLSGNGIVLDRSWMAACYERCLQQKQSDPSDVQSSIEEYMTHHRLLAVDMAALFAKGAKIRKGSNSPSEQEFWAECEAMSESIQSFANNWDPILSNPALEVTDFSSWRSGPDDSVVEPTSQRPFYTGELFPMNFAVVDRCAMKCMFMYKLALLEGRPPPVECRDEALKAARMFEAIELCPDAQPGALLAIHQSFAMTCLFLPKDERTTMWLRRKFALMESAG
jgi:hypothetical protein